MHEETCEQRICEITGKPYSGVMKWESVKGCVGINQEIISCRHQIAEDGDTAIHALLGE